jgi:hypothetical protein
VKQFTHIGLILLMFFQLSHKSVVVLNWKLNQKRITEKYCVNKNRPMLHCNGQCYLSKQMRRLDQEEQRERSRHSMPSERLKQIESPLILPQIPVFAILSSAISDLNSSHFNTAPDACSSAFGKSCFHPPEQLMTATA